MVQHTSCKAQTLTQASPHGKGFRPIRFGNGCPEIIFFESGFQTGKICVSMFIANALLFENQWHHCTVTVMWPGEQEKNLARDNSGGKQSCVCATGTAMFIWLYVTSCCVCLWGLYLVCGRWRILFTAPHVGVTHLLHPFQPAFCFHLYGILDLIIILSVPIFTGHLIDLMCVCVWMRFLFIYFSKPQKKNHLFA